MKPSVIILTYNSSESIAHTLSSVISVSDDIHIVDSGSTDNTIDIANGFGAIIHVHHFLNYGDQRNWAIDTLPIKYGWQLHLDADERLTDELCQEIKQLPEDAALDGYFIRRYIRFLNRILKHNLAPTWHMRLFRAGKGRCEVRKYDQHFICSGKTDQLKCSMIDDIKMSLSEWTYRHNRWSDAEVEEILAHKTSGRVGPKLTGNVIERKRYFRGIYDRAPLLIRSFALFIYRYIIKRGCLDGKEGLIFCVLQTLWFRFLVDAKLFESDHIKTSS
jgi:glycosyltransferase involved in cell wall biosynthesis